MTYSIVARDPESGELGVAVQTRWFNVGENASFLNKLGDVTKGNGEATIIK